MGMFDGILGGVIGAGATTLLNSFIEKQGGLQNVVSQFQKNGFGDTMKSWISQGQNLPITADQIAAAKAKLGSLIEERATYEAKIDRATLRMPFDGNILTLHLQDKVNSYLEKGAPFAALENTGFVTAQVEVAESDIHFVKVGSTVRVRAVSFFDDKEFKGKVTLIDRNVTVKPTGNVILVIATIENREGLLKTGMAGQAKVQSIDMPVWKAFTLAIVRFVQIQVWSWLP